MILQQVIKYTNANAIEATWVDGEQTRVVAYSDVQMLMFRDDVAQYGGDVAEHEALIAEVEAARLPPAAPAPPAVPQTVTRFQALAALHLAGKLTAVQAIMAAPETPTLAKLGWENALSFERNSPTLASLAAMLGMTSQDLDDLFTAAAGIAA